MLSYKTALAADFVRKGVLFLNFSLFKPYVKHQRKSARKDLIIEGLKLDWNWLWEPQNTKHFSPTAKYIAHKCLIPASEEKVSYFGISLYALFQSYEFILFLLTIKFWLKRQNRIKKSIFCEWMTCLFVFMKIIQFLGEWITSITNEIQRYEEIRIFGQKSTCLSNLKSKVCLI